MFTVILFLLSLTTLSICAQYICFYVQPMDLCIQIHLSSAKLNAIFFNSLLNAIFFRVNIKWICYNLCFMFQNFINRYCFTEDKRVICWVLFFFFDVIFIEKNEENFNKSWDTQSYTKTNRRCNRHVRSFVLLWGFRRSSLMECRHPWVWLQVCYST